MFDLIIKNGRIVDGTGRPEFRGSIGIRNGIITAVGPLADQSASTVIDANEQVVAPGFIEAHGHSDFSALANPQCENYVAMGVTTEVFGNCGASAFPLKPHRNRHGLSDAGGGRYPSVPPGIEVEWSSAAEYFQLLRTRGIGMNLVPLTGMSTLRAYVLNGEDRPARPEELELMKEMLIDSMEAGSRGFSTGLTYTGAINTSLSEMIELARVVGQYGGVYATHIRSYYHEDFKDAIQEAVAVAHSGGIPLILSHLTIHGKGNWGRADEILRLMDWYRCEGMEIYADTFSYPTIGVWWGPRAVFPGWAIGVDDPLKLPPDWPEVVGRLTEVISAPNSRPRLKTEVEERIASEKNSFLDQFFSHHGWDCIFLEETSPGSRFASFVGCSIETIAEQEDLDPCDLYFDMILEEGSNLSTSNIIIKPEDHQALLRDPYFMIGTDVRATSPNTADAPYNMTQVSPRHYGAFVRMIEQHVMRDGILSLPAAIRKMSALPARVFNLRDRGLIRVGMAADIVVFDRYRTREKATYRTPNVYPEGIYCTLVGGVPVYREGRFTGELPGRILTL